MIQGRQEITPSKILNKKHINQSKTRRTRKKENEARADKQLLGKSLKTG